MKINNREAFLEKIRAGKMPLGGVVTFADPAVTEVVCAAGFDFVWLDGEHGEFGRETAMQHLMAVRGTGVAGSVPGVTAAGTRRRTNPRSQATASSSDPVRLMLLGSKISAQT